MEEPTIPEFVAGMGKLREYEQMEEPVAYVHGKYTQEGADVYSISISDTDITIDLLVTRFPNGTVGLRLYGLTDRVVLGYERKAHLRV